jgi:hypothetical protein
MNTLEDDTLCATGSTTTELPTTELPTTENPSDLLVEPHDAKPLTREERLILIAARVAEHAKRQPKAKQPIFDEAEQREHERALRWWSGVSRSCKDDTPNAARRQAESEFRTSSSKGAGVLGQRGRW